MKRKAVGEPAKRAPRITTFNESSLGTGGADLEALLYRRVSPDGSPASGRIDLDPQLLLRMYRQMVFGREFDVIATKLAMRREIMTYAPHNGQEAAQVGFATALEDGDWLVPMYRDNLSMMVKGVPPENILRCRAGDEKGMRMPPGVNVLPYSTIVAAHIPHGAGIALASRLQGRDSVVLASIGDGATSKGDFHEGLNIAGTFNLPLIVAVQNNQWAISVPRRAQSATKTLAQKAVAYGVDGLLVDGNDVVASYEATKQAVEKARAGGGPTLIEYYSYRMGYHSTAELVSHKLRPEAEVETWTARDPIVRLEKYLQDQGLLEEASREAIRREAQSRVQTAVDSLKSLEQPSAAEMFNFMYERPTPQLLEQMRDGFGLTPTDGPGPEQAEPTATGGKPVNVRNAVNIALRQELERDKRVVLFGEDVGRSGGVFQVTKGLQEQFGPDRVFDTPLAEVGIAGLFLGLSIGGMIPIAEFQFDGFTPPAFDQFINNISRMRNRSRGRFSCRGVIRFPYGGGVSATEHHVESPEVYFAHTPGLKVVVPSSPYDAKGLLAAAVSEPDPIVFMEPKKMYDTPRLPVPEERYIVPIGKAKVSREGTDLTLISFGAMMTPTLEAAEALRSKDSVSAEVIDLRTVSPLDTRAIVASVQKTGRVVIVHEAQQSYGMGAEVAALIAEKALDSLRAPVLRVAGYDVVYPLERLGPLFYPGVDRIVKAARAVLAH